MQKTVFFVQTDFLLQEKDFEQLKDFVKLFEEHSVFPDQYSTLNLDENANLRLKAPTNDFKNFEGLSSAIFQKINEGYVLTNITQLKKLLSCK